MQDHSQILEKHSAAFTCSFSSLNCCSECDNNFSYFFSPHDVAELCFTMKLWNSPVFVGGWERKAISYLDGGPIIPCSQSTNSPHVPDMSEAQSLLSGRHQGKDEHSNIITELQEDSSSSHLIAYNDFN